MPYAEAGRTTGQSSACGEDHSSNAFILVKSKPRRSTLVRMDKEWGRTEESNKKGGEERELRIPEWGVKGGLHKVGLLNDQGWWVRVKPKGTESCGGRSFYLTMWTGTNG